MSRRSPFPALVAAALVVVACELGLRSQARYGIEAVVCALALAVAWRQQDALRLGPLLVLAVLLPTAIALVHLARGIGGDIDVETLYASQGNALLDGRYPHSEYPPGAVLLFALEASIGSPRSVNPFAMAVCQAAVVWAVWAARTARSGQASGAWFAAALALWPLNAFFWEFKFDLLPTALLALGLVAALRDRWALAGAALGAGAAVKWSPVLACVLLAVWLLATGRGRESVRLGAGFVASAALLVVPFVVRDAPAVWAAVSRQAPRRLTPESLWYLPLHAAGRASAPGAIFDAAAAPAWADTAAVATQIVCVAVLALLLVRRRPRREAAVAIAALGPAVFLLGNKIFSAQYLVTLVGAWAIAAALVAGRRRASLLATGVGVATAANLLVYPIGRFWLPASAVLFVTGIAVTAVLAVCAFARMPEEARTAGAATLPAA